MGCVGSFIRRMPNPKIDDNFLYFLDGALEYPTYSFKMPFHRVETYESTQSGVSATSSEVAYMQASHNTFEKVKTIQELQDATEAFLRGDLTATAYNFGALPELPSAFLDDLLQLNRLGFIPTGCQVGGTTKHVEKRFYVEGILPRRIFVQFLRETYLKMGDSCCVVPLERERSYEEIEGLKKANLYWLAKSGGLGVQHIPEVSGPCQMFQTCDEIFPFLVEEYVSVVVFGTSWEDSGSHILATLCEILARLQ